MHATTIIMAALAAFAAGSPIEERAAKYFGVSLYVNAAPQGETPILEPAPVEINKLTSLHLSKGSEVSRVAHLHEDRDSCHSY